MGLLLAAPSHTSQPVMHNRKPHASFDGGTKRHSSELMKSFFLKMYSSAIQQSRTQRNMQKHHHRKDPLTPGFPDPGKAHDHHPLTAGPDFPDPGGVHDHHLSTGGSPRSKFQEMTRQGFRIGRGSLAYLCFKPYLHPSNSCDSPFLICFFNLSSFQYSQPLGSSKSIAALKHFELFILDEFACCWSSCYVQSRP